MLPCTYSASRLRAASSRRHQVRAKNPRASALRSTSMTKAPRRRVSRKIIGPPIEIGVQLLRLDEMPQLLQAREWRRQKHLLRHPNLLEDPTQLCRASLNVPLATEIGQMLVDLLEGDAVAAVVAIVASDSDIAAGKDRRD